MFVNKLIIECVFECVFITVQQNLEQKKICMEKTLMAKICCLS